MATVTSPTQDVNVLYQQGDDHPLVFPVLVGAAPVDCTGWSAKAQIRDRASAVLHTWSTADGSAVCDEDGVSLLVDDSLTWDWTFGRYDVAATSPDGVRVVPAGGRFQVKAAVTR